MHNLTKLALLSSVALMAAAPETGSNKPAKPATKSAPAKGKADTSKTKGASKSGAKVDAKATKTAPATATKAGGGRRAPIFSDKAKVVEALQYVRDGKMDKFAAAGFSQHHIRQLGSGVSGGMFGPGQGFGYVEVVADTSPRPEGAKGRRPMVPKLTKDGEKFLKAEELRQARKSAAPADQKSTPKSTPKSKTVAAKPAEAPAAPTQEAAPEVPVTVPVGAEVKIETPANDQIIG